MRDRRMDDRVQLDKECLLYLKEIGELACVVKDISEVGIAFEVDYTDSLYKQLKEIKEIRFSYLDEFIFLGTEQSVIINANCDVVRVVKKKEKILIGCKLNANSEIRHYVTQMKVAAFMQTLERIKR